MPRTLSKAPKKKSSAKASETAGRILEMRPVKSRDLFPFMMILLIVAVAGITVAVLSFRRMSDALAYSDRSSAELSVVRAQAAELKNRLTDMQTLQTLASKDAAPPVIIPDGAWQTYSSPNLTLRYPPDFSVTKATASFPALTISNAAGRIEIFRMNDFDGERGVGTGEGKLPKETLMVGTDLADSRIQPYDAWLYYRADDAATKSSLEAIAASVKALR